MAGFRNKQKNCKQKIIYDANISMLQLNVPFDELVKNGAVYSCFNFLQIRLQNTSACFISQEYLWLTGRGDCRVMELKSDILQQVSTLYRRV